MKHCLEQLQCGPWPSPLVFLPVQSSLKILMIVLRSLLHSIKLSIMWDYCSSSNKHKPLSVTRIQGLARVWRSSYINPFYFPYGKLQKKKKKALGFCHNASLWKLCLQWSFVLLSVFRSSWQITHGSKSSSFKWREIFISLRWPQIRITFG